MYTEMAKPDTAISGCSDHREGYFVLTNDRTLGPIADIEADGFSQEGGARSRPESHGERAEVVSGGM